MNSPSELRERYLRLRKICSGLHDRLLKGLSREDLERGGRELGILRNGTFVLGNMEESAVLFDYCLYNLYRKGRNAVERFLEENPPAEGSEERFVLEAQKRSWYSIFKITKTIAEVGVEAQDILRQTEHLIADLSLSRCPCVGGLLAARVIPLGDFIMTSGASLPLGGGDKERDAFAGAIRRVCFEQNIVSFKQLTPVQEKELARTIIRLALGGGASSFIRYEDPQPRAGFRERSRKPAMATATKHIGRNDRCPCGSGKKFKHCCGGH